MGEASELGNEDIHSIIDTLELKPAKEELSS